METQTIHVTLTLSSRAAAELAEAGNDAGAVEEAVELWARRYDGWRPTPRIRMRHVLLLAFALNLAGLAGGAAWAHRGTQFRERTLSQLDRLATLDPPPRGHQHIDHIQP